jgi:glycerol uptake facilitator-like aquaporin
MRPVNSRAVAAEFIGTAGLLAVVIGSGIMGERLAAGNTALALLANSAATAGGLYVLILGLGPISGAHLNPVVSLVEAIEGALPWPRFALYSIAQCGGAIAGVWIAHAMFSLPILQASAKVRSEPGQWLAEFVATFGLIACIRLCARAAPASVAGAVATYIGAAYWFTSSTSFANPAVTIARSLSDTFAGIHFSSAPHFIAAQVAGAITSLAVCRWLLGPAR